MTVSTKSQGIMVVWCILGDAGFILSAVPRGSKYPRTLVPTAIEAMVFGTRVLINIGYLDPPGSETLGLQIAQSRSDLCTLGSKVGTTYILGALGEAAALARVLHPAGGHAFTLRRPGRVAWRRRSRAHDGCCPKLGALLESLSYPNPKQGPKKASAWLGIVLRRVQVSVT